MRNWASAGVSLMLMVSVAACGDSADGSSDETIKIGVVSSESGYAAWTGETERRAIETLAEQVNADGGIDGVLLEILFRDDQSDPEQAVGEARELIDEDVVAILGPSLTPTSLAIEPIVAGAEVPMISMSGGYQPAGSEEAPWGWSIVAGAGPAIAKVLDYAVANDLTNLASITPTDPLGEAGDKGLEALLEGDGPYAGQIERVGHEKFNLADIDVRGQLQKLNAGAPDLVFAGVSGESVVAIRKQMDELGMEEIPLATYHSNTTPQVLELLDGTSGDLILPGTAVNVASDLPEGDQREEVMTFVEAYAEKTDEAPMSTEGFGYDALKVLVEAMREVGPDPAAIKEWLDEGQVVMGINYPMEFSADKHVAGGVEQLLMMSADPGNGWTLLEE